MSVDMWAFMGLIASLAALAALLDDWRRGDPATLGYWTTTSRKP